jgi:hypothetical protein
MVPAPGLEPGRAGFKGRWAANYPTPDSEHLALVDAAVAATVSPRYRPGRRYGIGVPGSKLPLATTRIARRPRRDRMGRGAGIGAHFRHFGTTRTRPYDMNVA